MRRSKCVAFGTAVLILFAIAAPARAAAPPKGIAASGYELIDLQAGQVLLAHDPDLRLAPASTTKIMTGPCSP